MLITVSSDSSAVATSSASGIAVKISRWEMPVFVSYRILLYFASCFGGVYHQSRDDLELYYSGVSLVRRTVYYMNQGSKC